MTAITVRGEQVLAWRAARQGLAERLPGDDVVAVARRLAGLHAQVLSSAELTAWARLDAPRPDAVADALWERRALAKTWAMRGTLHAVAADDLALVTGALQTLRPRWLAPSWQRTFGVTAAEMERLLEALPAALDGPPLTREELAGAVAERAGAPHLAEVLGESWGAVLKPAAFLGLICFAPNDGQRVRFTRPDRWLDGALAAVEPQAAALELTRRYLARYGPATRDDLARWLGAPPAHAGRLLKALGDELGTVEVDGRASTMLAADVDELRAAEPSGVVRLLPAFDQLVVAAPRDLLGEELRSRVYRPQGWLSPVLAVDGAMAGVWRHERRGGRVEVTVEPFAARVPKAIRAGAEAEAERLAAFVGGALELRWA